MVNSTRSSAASSRDDSVLSIRSYKLCRVCGDEARCYHFGGLCCASCKAFFRRAVVNDQYKSYRCVYGGSCRIDVTSRKHCSHCRLNRCIAIGMDKKRFMSEELRIEMKLKSMKKLRTGESMMRLKPDRFPFFFSGDGLMAERPAISPVELREIDFLIQLCRKAYHSNTIPLETQSDCCPSSSALTAVIFATAIRRVFSFLLSVPQLEQLEPIIRMSLLKQRGMEAVIVLSSLTFNVSCRMWTRYGTTLLMEPRPLHVCAVDFERLHGPIVTQKHLDTISSLLRMNADERIIVLLSLIAFFTLEECPSIDSVSSTRISAVQEHFIELLKRYTMWKFGRSSEGVFARFILKLSDVREVDNLHKVARLQLSKDEIKQVGLQMGGLDLLRRK